MFTDLYFFDHNILHICFWTLPAIIVGLAMIVMTAVHNRNQKKREEEFEQELEQAKTVQTAEPAQV